MKIIAGTPAEDTVDFLSWKGCYQSFLRLIKCNLLLENNEIS